MFDYGDGSQGALNATSGFTFLPLNTKHQFTTVNVAAGASLSTSDTSGSVLYITATESITIDGTITLYARVPPGNNSWPVTINGVTYTSPGVANGGRGGHNVNGAVGGNQGNGFGGGGAGGALEGALKPGNGGAGGFPAGSGANGVSVPSNAGRAGLNASNSAGGSGAGGTASGGSATTGRGGNAYGGAGANGSVSLDGWSGGGGGGGGRAGQAGIHVVLSAPVVVINGSIITSGSPGTNGGAGATGATAGRASGSNVRGSGGGGGGGGNAGNIQINALSVSDSNATYTMLAGARGTGGTGRNAGLAGTAGTAGTLYTKIGSRPSPIHLETSISELSRLIVDYKLSVNPLRLTAKVESLGIVEGGPKVSVNAYGFGGGFGSATGYATHAYGSIIKPVIADSNVDTDNTFIDTFISNVELSQVHRLSVSSVSLSTKVDSKILRQAHELSIDNVDVYYGGTDPNIVQDYKLDVSSLVLNPYIQNISIAGASFLGVQSITIYPRTTNVALKQAHRLTTSNLRLGLDVYNIDLTEDRGLIVHSIKSDTRLTSPFFSQDYRLSVLDLTSNSILESTRVDQNHNIEVNNILSDTTLSEILLHEYTLLPIPDPVKLHLDSTQINLSQDYFLETDDLSLLPRTNWFKIINWDDLDVYFGYYAPTGSADGTLDVGKGPDAGYIINKSVGADRFKAATINTGNYGQGHVDEDRRI